MLISYVHAFISDPHYSEAEEGGSPPLTPILRK